MTTDFNQIAVEAESLAKDGKTATEIIEFLLGHNTSLQIASEVANRLVQEHAPTIELSASTAPQQTRVFVPSPTALSEFERMVLIFAPRCHQVYDPLEISVSPEQWAKNIARSAIELCRDKDESTTMKIGTRVREVEVKVDADGMPLVNENGEVVLDLDTDGGKKYIAGRYGVVLGNPATVEVVLRPFEGFENDPKPEAVVEDLYINPDALEHVRQSVDPTYVEFLADLVHVQWYFDDGTKDETEYGCWWHIPEELEELS